MTIHLSKDRWIELDGGDRGKSCTISAHLRPPSLDHLSNDGLAALRGMEALILAQYRHGFPLVGSVARTCIEAALDHIDRSFPA